MVKVKMLPVNRVLQGDCLKIMCEWPAETVDMVMTSPPYWGLRNYGELTEIDWGDWKGQLGLEPTWQMYVEHMVSICREIKRVLKRTGNMYLVLGDTYSASGAKGNHKGKEIAYSPPHRAKDYQPKCLMGMPWRIAFALISDGWVLRSRIVWHKDNPMPGSQRDRLTQTCEVIFHFVRNTGKALLWRNELTGEWLEKRPKQNYYHVETKKLREDRPGKEEKYVVDDVGNKQLVWKPLWRGFNYYYELDAIREPHQTSSIKRAGPSGIIPFNLRLRGIKQGKKGVFIKDGKVKQLKASHQEVESYVYPEKRQDLEVQELIKEVYKRLDRNVATYRGKNRLPNTNAKRIRAFDGRKIRETARQILKEKGIPESSKLVEYIHDHFSHPLGKNPGDVVQVQPEGHGHDRWAGQRGPGLRPWNERFHPKGKNPGDIIEDFSAVLNMVMQTYSNVADVEVEEWQGKSHSKNRQHGLRRLALNERKARIRFEIALDKLEIQGTLRKKLIAYWHNHSTHPKGKNPGDVIRGFSYSREGRVKYSHYPEENIERHLLPPPRDAMHPLGKNPGDYWGIPTKPFKGAHFAVYPEAICVRPVKSSCPPRGVVLDPMAGSGTTCVVAKKLGRKYVGIELNPDYVEIARKRLSAIPERLDVFLK